MKKNESVNLIVLLFILRIFFNDIIFLGFELAIQ